MYDFGKLLYQSKLFNPELKLITNIAYGDLKSRNKHGSFDFNTLEKGYYESGILINNFLNLYIFRFGVGFYYRYGPYSFVKTTDNFAFRLTIQTITKDIARALSIK